MRAEKESQKVIVSRRDTGLTPDVTGEGRRAEEVGQEVMGTGRRAQVTGRREPKASGSGGGVMGSSKGYHTGGQRRRVQI